MEKFNFNIKSVIDCLAPSEVTMITGGHCVGKTMLALNIAAQYGINENKTVAIFSLEWSDCQGVQRILHMLANVEMRDVKRKSVSPKRTGTTWIRRRSIEKKVKSLLMIVCILHFQR